MEGHMKKVILFFLLGLILVSCNTKNDELESEIESLKNLLDENILQYDAVNDQLNDLRLENNKLQESVAQIEKDNDDLSNGQKQLESLVIEKETIIDLLENEKSELETLLWQAGNRKDITLIAADDNRINYVVSNKENSIYTVNILAFDNGDYQISHSFESLNIDAPGTGEILKMQILGSIYDFQVIELVWDEAIEDFKETQIVEEVSKISNTIVELDTYLACGIPGGKVRWKNSDGKTFEFYLSQDGYGFSGSIILCP